MSNEDLKPITFDELVDYGKKAGAVCVNGLPWSFTYQGFPVTHENDECYLITSGNVTVRFHKGDTLSARPGYLICHPGPVVGARVQAAP